MPFSDRKTFLPRVLFLSGAVMTFFVILFANMNGKLPQGTYRTVDNMVSNMPMAVSNEEPLETTPAKVSYYPLTRADTARAKNALENLTHSAFTSILVKIDEQKPQKSGQIVDIILDGAGLSEISSQKRMVVARMFSAKKALKGVTFIKKTGLDKKGAFSLFKMVCKTQIDNIEDKLPE